MALAMGLQQDGQHGKKHKIHNLKKRRQTMYSKGQIGSF
jgi:hypothetical protein